MKTHTDKAVEGLMGYFGLSSKLPWTRPTESGSKTSWMKSLQPAAGGSGEENQPMMFPVMSSIGVRDLLRATEGGVMTPELAEELMRLSSGVMPHSRLNQGRGRETSGE